jgi:hypothetical protein
MEGNGSPSRRPSDVLRNHAALPPSLRVPIAWIDEGGVLKVGPRSGGPSAESEEKHEPVSDIDTAVVDSLKALDLEWPIREATLAVHCGNGFDAGFSPYRRARFSR